MSHRIEINLKAALPTLCAACLKFSFSMKFAEIVPTTFLSYSLDKPEKKIQSHLN